MHIGASWVIMGKKNGGALMYREQYPYLYETHLHTSMVSACAHNTPEEMVRAAKRAGYTGIFVTEHNWRANSCIDKTLPWEAWIDAMAGSYYAAKAEGEKVGLQVFFAYEAGFHGTPHHGADFLVYGLSPQWLKAHPQLRDMGVKEHLQFVRSAGAMVIHAHPYREAAYIPQVFLFPEDVDGVEVLNGAHSSPKSGNHNSLKADQLAAEYARAQGLPMTAGSDIHCADLFGGGVALRQPIYSPEDYCAVIRQDWDRVLTNGFHVCDSRGNFLPGHADWTPEQEN